MANNIAPPIYNGTETMTQYNRRVNEYIKNMKKDTYNEVLSFINLILIDSTKKKKEYESLLQIKKVSHTKLTKCITQKKDIFYEGVCKFNDNYKLGINSKRVMSDSSYTINAISSILSFIGYKLISKSENEEIYYNCVSIRT